MYEDRTEESNGTEFEPENIPVALSSEEIAEVTAELRF